MIQCLPHLKHFLGKRQFESLCEHYYTQKKSLDRELRRITPTLTKEHIQTFTTNRTPKKDPPRLLSTGFDLEYLDSPNPVGSYDPDKDGSVEIPNSPSDDCIRCICGNAEDDGRMIQCDTCNFWLHTECHDSIDSEQVKVKSLCYLGR